MGGKRTLALRFFRGPFPDSKRVATKVSHVSHNRRVQPWEKLYQNEVGPSVAAADAMFSVSWLDGDNLHDSRWTTEHYRTKLARPLSAKVVVKYASAGERLVQLRV
jgi:hypothetical protein